MKDPEPEFRPLRYYARFSPAERLEKIVELLVKASLRLLNEETAKETQTPEPEKSQERLVPKRGRIPFGQQRGVGGLEPNPIETNLIEEITRLVSEKKSLREIAEHLNALDKTSRRAGHWSATAVWRISRRLRK